MSSVIHQDFENPPVTVLLTRHDRDVVRVIPAGVPRARPADPTGLRDDDRGRARLLLHIACQDGSQSLAGLPARYLCGTPVRVLLGTIAPGEGPDGPGVCPICAGLDHPG